MVDPTPVRLLVILREDRCKRMEIISVPDTVEVLIEQVKHSCRLCVSIRLQYRDDFGMFVNLGSTSVIKVVLYNHQGHTVGS